MLPSVTALVPNTNTAAMAPLASVAGMAAAIIGTVSTIGGAVLGGVVDRAYDGSVLPFTVAAFVFSLAAGAAVLVARMAPTPVGQDLLVEGEAAAPALLD
jgi:DHA1 family bicyclomycin/chloramphenicol resistance-like MFS transporter